MTPSRIRFSRNVQSLVLNIHTCIEDAGLRVSFLSQKIRQTQRIRAPSAKLSAAINDYHPQILSLVICYPDESNDDNGYRNIEMNAKAESIRGEMYNYRASIRFIFFGYSKRIILLFFDSNV